MKGIPPRAWQHLRRLLGLEMAPYDPARVVQVEGVGVWYWACLYAWVTMIAALLACSVFMANPIFVAEIGLLMVVAFPVAYHLHYSRVSQLAVNYVVFLAAVVLGIAQFGPTVAAYFRQPPEDVYMALRFLIAMCLWITAFRAFSVRTITELVQTILPATSIVLLSLVAIRHYSALMGMALLLFGSLALLALEHRLLLEGAYADVGRLSFSRTRRSSGTLYSWPALYLLALFVAVGVGFWSARAELSTSFADNVRTYLTSITARHLMSRVGDYTPPSSLWLPRLEPPQGRQIVMEIECERPTNWRTTAYDTYTLRTWMRRLAGNRVTEADPAGAWQIPREGSGLSNATVTTELRVTPHVAFGAAIPVALYPVSVQIPVASIYYNPDGTISPRTYAIGRQTYTVIAEVPPTLPNAGGIAHPVDRQVLQDRYLQLPEDLAPEIKELALELTADAPTDFEKARAIELHLAYEYEYDLATPRTWPKELVEAFLFDTRRGYCYHFATAMVIMCRSIGLPARMAVGFTRGEVRDPEKDLYVVRGEDAHAWPEVYVAEGGWMSFEPTPAAREQEQRTFGDVWREVTGSVKQRLAVVVAYARSYWPLAAGGLLILTVVFVGSRSYLEWHRNRPPLATGSRERIVWAYRRMRKLLAAHGAPDWPQTPAHEFVGSIPDALAHVRGDAHEIAVQYTVARFSGRPAESASADQVLSALHQLRQSLKQKRQ